ncbi:hypothetical protein TVAG_145050 [Trichomonas vaginalis G3]|uniref:Uncharacterized protein n=1 Tax=Trichomonas vaginalis (strain ATCC PRA-98 / G3) TaxID=412133 RepID=A2G0C2_TRIV3|nr:hypothetical protein TVAGG3_0893660 [Trichomonas vaginalis G3]EAX89397.1 hypothetical protein TVAG_145050 [Trichomonas vaginalis G3]KAI5502897.1 hypothetical protein TVAGG3_0893660 [Trichomonas vaginalis G3]|eukprot:XP_001302327.1 hypothetical protein [Trichomonas vaginalis G3]
MDTSDSSIIDLSKEWKMKADETIKATIEEINKGTENYSQTQQLRSDVAQIQQQTTKHQATLAAAAQEGEENEKDRQEWAKNQISELNDQTKQELESIEALRAKQQAYYQSQLAGKNKIWEKCLQERREEASRLRAMIEQLNSDINVARNEAKSDIEAAKKRAKESAKIIRANREKQIQTIADLTNQIQKERNSHAPNLKQTTAQANQNLAQKKEQLSRLEQNLLTLKSKLREKESNNSNKFRYSVRTIKDLRAQLQVQKDAEKQKQQELMNMRKMCASVSRKISAYKDEAASLKRQLAMMTKDNEELQSEIVKLERQMFPQVFKPLQ